MITIKFTPNTIIEYFPRQGEQILNFSNFAEVCRKVVENNPIPSDEILKSLKRPLMHFEDVYTKKNETNGFCLETLQLADELYEKGQHKLSAILYAEVFRNADKELMSTEQYFNAVNKAILISRESNDKIHLVYKLEGLANIYKTKGQKNEQVAVLEKKVDLLNKIFKNYKNAKANYCSLGKEVPSEEQLAKNMVFTLSELRDMHDGEKAIKYNEQIIKFNRAYNSNKKPNGKPAIIDNDYLRPSKKFKSPKKVYNVSAYSNVNNLTPEINLIAYA